MALGTRYRRNMDRTDKQIMNNLDRHFVLTQKLLQSAHMEGNVLTEEEASKKAYRIIIGAEK